MIVDIRFTWVKAHGGLPGAWLMVDCRVGYFILVGDFAPGSTRYWWATFRLGGSWRIAIEDTSCWWVTFLRGLLGAGESLFEWGGSWKIVVEGSLLWRVTFLQGLLGSGGTLFEWGDSWRIVVEDTS